MTEGTNITEEIKAHFKALISGEYNNFALFSCFVNGEPTAAIVTINKTGDDFDIVPIFIAVSPNMKITDHEGNQPSPLEVKL